MNRIKNIAFSALMAIGAFSMVTYTACNKDECKDVVCANNGTCIDGNCVCQPGSGYEGPNCQTQSRAKFIGQYTVTASCQNSYTVRIDSTSANVTRVTISNLANLNVAAGVTTTVYATIDGNTLTIPTQTVTGFSSAVITASGTGTINSAGDLEVDYSIIAGGTTNNCVNTTWEK